MLELILRRVGALGLVLLGLVIITFCVSYAIPADPARLAAGLEAAPEQVEQYRRLMGLDKPVPVQFWRYFTRLLRGDLGRSFSTRRPIIQDLILFFPASMELAVCGMIFYVLVGIPLGIVAALQVDRLLDYVARTITLLALAMPSFVLALLLQFIFGGILGWFPIDGRLAPDIMPPRRVTGFWTIDSILGGDWVAFRSIVSHLVLPTLAIAMGRFAVAVRFTRAGLLDVMQEDFIRTARAKGLSETVVMWGHAMKNAVIPLVTVLGLQFGYLLGGVVFVEVVFSWPGLGRYAVSSLFAFDFPAVMGATLVIGTVYVVVNSFVDIAYLYLDPRLRS